MSAGTPATPELHGKMESGYIVRARVAVQDANNKEREGKDQRDWVTDEYRSYAIERKGSNRGFGGAK